MIEELERRRLFNLAVFGAEQMPFAGNAVAVDVATASDGQSVVLAEIVNNPTISFIAVHYAADGSQIGEPTLLHSYTGFFDLERDQDQVAVSINDAGAAIAAYHIPDLGDADPGGIFVQRFGVASVGEPLLIAAPLSDNESVSAPAVALDNSSGFVVGWNDEVSIGEGIDHLNAVLRFYDQTDQPLNEPFNLGGNTGASSDNSGPGPLYIDIKKDGSEAVYAFPRYDYPDDKTDQLIFGRATPTGPLDAFNNALNDVQWSDSFFAGGSGQAIDDADEASVSINDDGSFVIGYRRYVTLQTRDDPTVQAAYVQRFNAAGEKVGDPIRLGDTLAGEGIRTGTHSPAVTMTSDGGLVSIFIQTVGQTDTLYARRYDSSGAPDPAGPVVIASGPTATINPFDAAINAAPRPAIASDDAGRAILVFVDNDHRAHVRRLSTNLAEVDNSTLYVLGTPGNDLFTITSTDGFVTVDRDNRTQVFPPAAGVTTLAINALAGNDVIFNRTILHSTLQGGDGRDSIVGGDGNDFISGNAGDDTLIGGLGADRIAGNGGRDHLYGNGGKDRLYGGEHRDYLYGQGGDDVLFGGGDADHLNAGGGADTLHGGAGGDSFITTDGAVDQLFGDEGPDSAAADASDLLDSI